MSGLALTLAVQRRDRVMKTVLLSQPVARIGTSERSEVRLDDDAVALVHAVIEMDEDPILIDLGSTHGTWVNGARVNRCRLQPGDEIRIGNTLLQVQRVDRS